MSQNTQNNQNSHHDIAEAYQAFMQGYVKRINDATLRVEIGGVRIGKAKYSRLAQINLKTKIITFSRYAIENVPERGRRYLVLHELAHVKEASHNNNFWNIVKTYEPSYKQIGKELEQAFQKNVLAEQKKEKALLRLKINPSSRQEEIIYQTRLFPISKFDSLDSKQTFPLKNLSENKNILKSQNLGTGLIYPSYEENDINFEAFQTNNVFSCNDEEFFSLDDFENNIDKGLIIGGSDNFENLPDDYLSDDYYDHI